MNSLKKIILLLHRNLQLVKVLSYLFIVSFSPAVKPEKVVHIGCGRSHTVAACRECCLCSVFCVGDRAMSRIFVSVAVIAQH